MKLPSLDKNLVFIWQELLDDRSRKLALHALSRVLMGAALLVVTPYAIGFYIDGLTNQEHAALIMAACMYVSLELSGIALGWWRQQVREYFFQQAFWHIPQKITERYYRRPLAWLSGGDSEIDGGGVESLKVKVWNVTGSYIFQILPTWGFVLFGIVACTYANIWLGLLATCYVIVERLISSKEAEYIYREMRPVIDLFKKWERRMQEWWRNTDHVKSHGVETKVLGQIRTEVQGALRGDDAVWRIYFARAVALHRLRALLFSSALYGLLGYLTFTGSVTLAVAVLVFFSFEKIRNSLADLNEQQREVQFNMASIAKYRRVLTQPVPFSFDSGADFVAGPMSVQFDCVSHTVTDGEETKLVLRDVSLSIAAGEKIGIVGPSGAGKSQLLSLLVKATNPAAGTISVAKQDLATLKSESLLRYYGVIMQKSEPFEDHVLGNLLFGVSHLDMPVAYSELSKTEQEHICTQAELSLQKAGLQPSDFPEGLWTNIGFKGLKLSGGQQQRLQIAAAHMKLGFCDDRPRLIIADEPTASLDSLSELTVMENLQDKLPEGTTMLMVAHRLSTVANMDRIVFVRPLAHCSDTAVQVTAHNSLGELYEQETLFRKMADSQGFRL